MFFVHLSTDSFIPGAKGGTSCFSDGYFLLFHPTLLYEFTEVADFVLWVILEFWYEFIQTNSYNCYTNCIVPIRTRCGFCTNSYNCYANCIVRIRIQCGFCTNSYKFLYELYSTNSYKV